VHLFLDSPVFLTALGLPSESRPACARLLDRAGEGELSLHTGAECIQEIVFHRLRLQGVDLAVAQTHAVRALCVVHPMDDEVLETGLGLIRDDAGAGARRVYSCDGTDRGVRHPRDDRPPLR
jgi:predicted nucleic acid-binding protein